MGTFSEMFCGSTEIPTEECCFLKFSEQFENMTSKRTMLETLSWMYWNIPSEEHCFLKFFELFENIPNVKSFGEPS
jgi:hypothetical protein